MPGIQIGQILVEQGVLSSAQVRHILQIQKLSHRPFGDLAERLYGVSPQAIEGAWVEQYVRSAGVTDLRPMRFDPACRELVNRRQAWQFHVLPVARDEDSLHVATDADHLIRAVNFCARRLSDPVLFLIAPRAQLQRYLMEHYPVPGHMARFAEQLIEKAAR